MAAIIDRLEASPLLNFLEALYGSTNDLYYLCSSENPNAQVINVMFDTIQDTVMAFAHENQEIRREFNSRVRVERHHARLQAQRARSAVERAARQNTEEEHRARLAYQREMVLDLTEDAPLPAPAPVARPRPRAAPVRRAPPGPRAPVTRMKKPISKALKQSELEVMMPDNCGICMEQNTRANTVTTCCGHSFCKACYDMMLNHTANLPDRRQRKVKCPMCRKECPQVTEYRARKTPVRRNALVPAPHPEGIVSI
jgi:hypothetical protein